VQGRLGCSATLLANAGVAVGGGEGARSLAQVRVLGDLVRGSWDLRLAVGGVGRREWDGAKSAAACRSPAFLPPGADSRQDGAGGTPSSNGVPPTYSWIRMILPGPISVTNSSRVAGS